MQLVQAAKRDERSIAQQVTYYIKRGLEAQNESTQAAPVGVVDERTGEVYPSHKARRQAMLKRLRTFHETHGTVQVDIDEINKIIKEGHEERADRIMECLS